MLSTEAFQALAERFVLFCHARSEDHPSPYPDLPAKFGVVGTPTLCFMDAEGNFLAAHSGDHSVSALAHTASLVESLPDLRARAGNDPQALRETFLVELELGLIPLEQARRKADELGPLEEPAARRLEILLLTQEVMEIARHASDLLALSVHGARFVALYDQGMIPRGDSAARVFFQAILAHGATQQDRTTFDMALDELTELLQDQRNDHRFQQKLKEMQDLYEQFGDGPVR